MLDVLLLALPIPVIGTIVRYRASYTPKDGKVSPPTDTLPITLPPSAVVTHSAAATTAFEPVASDIEHVKVEVEQVKIEPVVSLADDVDTGPGRLVPTFFGVFQKVWQEEKLEGIFKGILPGLFSFLFFSRGYVSPAPSSISHSYYTILPYNLFYLVFMAATYRIITTHHKMRYSAPKEMLCLLFSDYERKHPFKSLYHSGLVAPYLAQILLNMLVVQVLYQRLGSVGPLLDHFDGEEWWKVFHHPVWNEWFKAAAYWLIAIISTIFLVPIDVVITRLAIQPLYNNPESTENKDMQKLQDVGHLAPPSYLRLTTEQLPYSGFKNCLDRIIQEEGYGPLYRSWFLTFIGCLIPNLR